jgi:hypothetical protein
MRLKGACLLILLAGCDGGAPPFEELPLRDALCADPQMVASLTESAKGTLAARFEAARTSDVASDEIGENVTAKPAALVAALDRARQRRQGEALIVGTIGNGVARPIGDRAIPPGAPALPPIEGVPADATAQIETRALDTQAGAAVRALLAASGAHHLYRVVGWPAGAVAIDDTVYVNASWLVGLAPGAGEKADGGSVAGSSSPGRSAAGVSRPPAASVSLDTGEAAAGPAGAPATPDRTPTLVPRRALATGDRVDAGDESSPSGSANLGDACSACADSAASGDDSCDSGDYASDDSGDSCDSSDDSADDSCNNTADDAGDSCSGAAVADDSAPAANCQVSRGGRRNSFGTLAWLLAPLAFLLLRRRP